jgi:type I restriction enzyme S subunit
MPFDPRLPRYIRITDISERGQLSDDDPRSIEATAATGSEVHAGDILLARSGATVGKSYLHRLEGAYAHAGYLIRLRPDITKIDPEYLFQFTYSPQYLRWVEISQRAGAQPNINATEYSSLRVPVPPLPVQRRIAEVLRTWDEAIEKTERLIEAKTTNFAHWSHALLTGRHRLGRRRSNWPSLALTEVTTEATARNGAAEIGVDAVMGVNKIHGMIPMKDHVRASDLSRYKVVRPEAFAYNPMRLNIGSIAQNQHARDVLVSPDYVVFDANPDFLLPAYFDHIRRTPMWSRFVKSAGSGGVRVRIYYNDFADFILELPPLAEQARIVEVLDAGRREIAILEQQRNALAKQKRGLMQKLLTGEWPVSVPKSRGAAA